MSLDRSYKIEKNGPSALGWETYKADVQQELNALLESGESLEGPFQLLIERHPSLLPWMYGTFGGGHHGLLNNAVITQPDLVAMGAKRPDFLMLASDSGSFYAIMVEIESPTKKWFLRNGQPTAQLTQAQNQLSDWKAWFRNPNNVGNFLEDYRVPDWQRRLTFEQRYFLIYGRRSEGARLKRRRDLERPYEHYFSYDHLSPSEDLRDTVTARVDKDGYRAVYMPPTLQLGPIAALDLVELRDKNEAVDASNAISAERAAFLKRRFLYWDNWTKEEKKGSIGMGDRE